MLLPVRMKEEINLVNHNDTWSTSDRFHPNESIELNTTIGNLCTDIDHSLKTVAHHVIGQPIRCRIFCHLNSGCEFIILCINSKPFDCWYSMCNRFKKGSVCSFELCSFFEAKIVFINPIKRTFKVYLLAIKRTFICLFKF